MECLLWSFLAVFFCLVNMHSLLLHAIMCWESLMSLCCSVSVFIAASSVLRRRCVHLLDACRGLAALHCSTCYVDYHEQRRVPWFDLKNERIPVSSSRFPFARLLLLLFTHPSLSCSLSVYLFPHLSISLSIYLSTSPPPPLSLSLYLFSLFLYLTF